MVDAIRATVADTLEDMTDLAADEGMTRDALTLLGSTRNDAYEVGVIRESISIVDFWRKPDQVRRLRASIDTELMVSGIVPIQNQHQRIAVELAKLAEKRHAELLRS